MLGEKMTVNVRRARLLVTWLLILKGSGVGVSAQVSQERARNIVGKNFLGAEEVAEHFGIRLSPEEQEKVRQIPFSERTLLECKDSHILLLGVARDDSGNPLTIARLRQMFPRGGQPRFRSYPKPAAVSESYASKETPQLRWYLIAKGLVEESRSKPYWQQEKLLAENQYRERAVVYVYMMFLMFKARGEYIFRTDLVWSSCAGSDGAPVAAGYFDREGLYVSDWWLRPDVHFGIAPARKPDFR